LIFLSRELATRCIVALADLLAPRDQFAGCAVGKCIHPHCDKHLVRPAELLTRINAPALAAQPFAVEQVGARSFRRDAAPT